MSKSKMRIGSILLVVAMLMTLLPVGVFAAGEIFEVDGTGYNDFDTALTAAERDSSKTVTLVGSFTPNEGQMNQLLQKDVNVKIEAGASLILPSDSEGTEAWFGGADARMNIKEGSITLSGLNQLAQGNCTWTLSNDAQVEIPTGKTAYLHFSVNPDTKLGVKLVVLNGATLDVNGTLRAISGTRASTVEVSGQMNVNGAVSAAEKTTTTVEKTGQVVIAETGKVETTGTLAVTANDESNNITLAEGAVLSVPARTDTSAVKNESRTEVQTYTDANGNTVCVVSDVDAPEAAIGGKLYKTLGEALKAAVSGDTITLTSSSEVTMPEGWNVLPEGVAIAIPTGKTLTVANGLTLSDDSGFVVSGTLKADAEGDNIKGNTDSAYIQLLAGGKFVKGDSSNTDIITGTDKYVWSYLKNDGTAVVANGEWKNVTEDLVATAEYWQALVSQSGEGDVYKPTWEELRNLTYFCQKAIEADTKDTAHDYTLRTTDVNDFITATITKLDMSNQIMIDRGDSGILAGYTGLTYLNLDNTGLTEVGGLAKMANLKELHLVGVKIGDLGNLVQVGVADTLEVLDVSNTDVTKLESIWDADSSKSAFPNLTTLTAKNLSLDSISGLVEIVSASGFGASTVTLWDLSGSTILYTHKDHVDAVTAKLAEKFKAPTVIYPDDGGSTTTPTSYGITVSTAENGTVKSSNSSAAKDATVTITVTPGEGYVLDTLTVTDKDNNTVALTKVSDTQYTFKMPASAVTVKATFKKDEGTQPAALPFNDVSESEWFYEAVKYVYDKGMMNGVSDTAFAPYSNLTRGMIAQVLYNLEGKPAVSGSAYTDVAADQWYNDAVNWAAQKGIVTGYGDGTFGPMDNITREQMAAILYRYAQYKGYDVSAKGDLTAFTDGNTVSDWAKDAMSWAVGTALFNGKGDGILDPTTTATRAEVAKILMTYCENVAK